MAYNRWLSGSQYYQPTDVLHYGRKGMKWGKHIFGIDPNQFRKLTFGPKLDSESLQTLLQRGEIGFDAFKEMISRQNFVNELTWQIKSQSPSTNRSAPSKPTQNAVKRGSETVKNVTETVANNVRERKAQEDKYRRIAEDKAKMARESEERAEKVAKERSRANARNKAILDEDKEAGPASKGGSKRVSKGVEKRNAAETPRSESKGTEKPNTAETSYSNEKDANENYRQLILDYLDSAKTQNEEERRKQDEEERQARAAQRDEELRQEREKWLRSILKIAKYLNRIIAHI